MTEQASAEIKNATRLGMVVDLDKCMGCWTCAVACKQENNVPEGMFYLRVLTVGGDNIDVPAGTFPNLSLAYQTTNCFHCDNPPCVKACPVQATYKQDNGLVAIDYDRCIGCRYCMVACPYDNRVFNWRDPVQDPAADVAPVGYVEPRQQGRRGEVHVLRASRCRGARATLRGRLPRGRTHLRGSGRSRQRGVAPAARACELRGLPGEGHRTERALPHADGTQGRCRGR